MYNIIFFTNVLKLLDERGMTKQGLSDAAGVSISFLSDLTNGKANPSLKTMEAIADALQVPLSILLESTDLDKRILDQDNASLSGRIPVGYESVFAILPERQAFIVRKWRKEAEEFLLKPSR